MLSLTKPKGSFPLKRDLAGSGHLSITDYSRWLLARSPQTPNQRGPRGSVKTNQFAFLCTSRPPRPPNHTWKIRTYNLNGCVGGGGGCGFVHLYYLQLKEATLWSRHGSWNAGKPGDPVCTLYSILILVFKPINTSLETTIPSLLMSHYHILGRI